MFHKGWTPEQVGRLTMMDLRILADEKAPVASGGYHGETLKGKTAAEIEAMQAEVADKRNSWEE